MVTYHNLDLNPCSHGGKPSTVPMSYPTTSSLVGSKGQLWLSGQITRFAWSELCV